MSARWSVCALALATVGESECSEWSDWRAAQRGVIDEGRAHLARSVSCHVPRQVSSVGRSRGRPLLASPASPRQSPHTVGKLVTRRSFLGPEPHPTLAMRWARGAHPQRLEAPNETGDSLVATCWASRARCEVLYKSGLVRPAANLTLPASGATSGRWLVARAWSVTRAPGASE